jgi:hypothetical protein
MTQSDHHAPSQKNVCMALAFMTFAFLGVTFMHDRLGHAAKKYDSARGDTIVVPQDETVADDLLEQESRRLAGPGAVDCGRLPVAGDPKPASDCVLSAQKMGKPFRVRYDMQGVDSFVAVALVRSRTRTVDDLLYDSDPSRGGHAAATVCLRRCPVPVRFRLNSDGRVDRF